VDRPQTRYAKSGDLSIAYQVVGDGPIDLVYVIGWVSNIDVVWEEPSYERFLRRLASFSRLIIFDKRGTGLSDPVSTVDLPTMEQRMDDVRAVMDAAGSEKAALLGISEGGPLCLLFAATYPRRTEAVAVIGSYARAARTVDAVGARTAEQWDKELTWLQQHWGDEVARQTLRARAPSVYGDPLFRDWWGRYLRASASPGAAAALARMNRQLDVRPALDAVTVPTLVIHASHDGAIQADNGRFLAKRIAGARYIEMDSRDHLPWVIGKDADTVVAAVQELLTGKSDGHEPTRILATVLYTDMVDSTKTAAAMGDKQWRKVVTTHEEVARREVDRARGKLVKTMGDGVLAMFDGPARAVRCAVALRDAIKPLGIETRAGLHTGEVELVNDDIAGIASSIGARVMALAAGGEVLVPHTVKDLVAGSGIVFEARGQHALKGVPGDWSIYAVTES
jgi:class 3 adenylate cyclase